jgi:hypothetical protein
MIKNLSSLLFFLFTGILLAQSNQPKIEIPEQNFDFGKIKEGIYVSHEFEVKNVGTGDLVIEKVRASCGCTAATPDDNIVKPGESTKIKVTFNTTRRIGMQTKHVYIFTNAPDEQDARLTFTANIYKEPAKSNEIKPDITLEKNYHNFGDVEAGVVLSLEININNEGNADLELSGIKTDCDCITTTLSAYTVKPNEAVQLLMNLDTTELKGTITRRVTILSNDPLYPEKTFSIFVNVKGK